MVISSAETNSSTKALLTLLIDGKDISKLEIEEPIKALDAIEDVRLLIEEVYLLSMYHRIHEGSSSEALKEQLNRIERNIGELYLENLSDRLIFYKFHFSKVLCGLETDLPKEAGSLAKPENLNDLDSLALAGSLLLFIGMFLKIPALYEDGILISELIYDIVNEKGEADVFFFFEKGAYQKDACRASIFILLSLYSYVTENFEGNSILRKIDPYEGGLFQSLEVEKRLQCRLLEIVKPFIEDSEKRKVAKFLSDDLIKLTSDKFSYLTSSDKKVGIGSVSYENEIIIPSFGPHILPLGRNDLYGVNEPVSKDYDFHDNMVKMWNRVKSKSGYGNHWIYTSVTNTEEKINIESFIWSEKKEESLSLIFFLRGEKINASERSFLSKGLERALVKTNKIEIELGGKKMQMLLKESMEVEIIPLAGQQYFWNSDFIISLPFVSDRITTIDILMD